MMASRPCSIFGSGTSSQRMSPFAVPTECLHEMLLMDRLRARASRPEFGGKGKKNRERANRVDDLAAAAREVQERRCEKHGNAEQEVEHEMEANPEEADCAKFIISKEAVDDHHEPERDEDMAGVSGPSEI